MNKRKRYPELTDRQKRNRLAEKRNAIRYVGNTRGNKQAHEIVPVLCDGRVLHINEQEIDGMRLSPILINENDTQNESDDSLQERDYVDESSSNEESTDASTNSEETFTEKLARTLKETNISLRQGNAILETLRKHPCLHSLPKDIRTLLGTCKFFARIRKVEPGEYWHLGVSNAVTSELSHARYIPPLLEIDISTDGAAADSRGLIQYWPLQIRIVNLVNSRPLIIGVYRGKGKPSNVDEFFKDFVAEMKDLLTDGVSFRGECIPIKIRAFIADAPARAFVLRHRGHMSMHPCSKCKVVGTRYEQQFRRNVRRGTAFYGTNHESRTDDDAINRFDTDHYLEEPSPLTQLNVGLVICVPYEYMHPALIGVMKKICEALFDGKHLQRAKLSGFKTNIVSVRLQAMDSSCPQDFQRRARAISEFHNYKATEFRHLLLYAGPVILKGVLEEDFYEHFLLFHTSMRILASSNPPEYLLQVADRSLKLFVSSADELYGPSFLSYNVHCLVHLTEDVRRFGPLDSYSAFPFENNMPMFKKFVRNHHRPLQQFAFRLMERNHMFPSKSYVPSNLIVPSKKHFEGLLPPDTAPEYVQYKQLMIGNTRFSVQIKDNCCQMRDKSLCKIVNILQDNDSYYFVVRRFLNIDNLYDTGIPSNQVGVYKCSNLAHELEIISINNVISKCYCTKLCKATCSQQSGEDYRHETNASRTHRQDESNRDFDDVRFADIEHPNAGVSIKSRTTGSKEKSDYPVSSVQQGVVLEDITGQNIDLYSFPTAITRGEDALSNCSSRLGLREILLNEPNAPDEIEDLCSNKANKENSPLSDAQSINIRWNSFEIRMINLYNKQMEKTRTELKSQLTEHLQQFDGQLLQKIAQMERNLKQAIANNGNAEHDYDAPNGLPFRTLLDFRRFEIGEGIPPGDLKKYLTFVGGLTHRDATNQFFKETLTDDLANEFTWLGGNGKKKLKGTRYAKILHGALSSCNNLAKLSVAQFGNVVQHALHVAKQRDRDRRGRHERVRQRALRHRDNDDSENEDSENENQTGSEYQSENEESLGNEETENKEEIENEEETENEEAV